MSNNSCPYCKELIKADAIICKHCHSSLHHTREEMVIAEVMERIRLTPLPAIEKPSVSPCKALCYANLGVTKYV